MKKAEESAVWRRGNANGPRARELLVDIATTPDLEIHQLHRASAVTPPGAVAPGINAAGYWDACRPQRWGLDWHVNDGLELAFVARGSSVFSTPDSTTKLDPSLFTMTRPWQRHKVGDPTIDSSLLHWIIIDVTASTPESEWIWPAWLALSKDDLARLTSLIRSTDLSVWRATPRISEAFGKIRNTIDSSFAPTFDSELRLAVSELLLGVLIALDSHEELEEPGPADSTRSVQRFLGLLDDHLEECWSLEEMSRRCGMGRSRFAQICRELTNMSPVEYLIYRRMLRAAEMLSNREPASITEISVRCGFQSGQYFSSTFRKHFGVSPRQYRVMSEERGG